LADLIANNAESRKTLLFRPVYCCRIFGAVVKPVSMSGIYRTALLCFVADRDQIIEAVVAEFIDAFGAVTRDIINGDVPSLLWLVKPVFSNL
jgi:hypothetical protein